MTSSFTRILVARQSPQNGCEGPDGEWLVPAAPSDIRTRKLARDSYVFVTVQGRRANKYGWVADLGRDLGAEELRQMDGLGLRARLGDDAVFELPEVDWYERYLRAVSRFEAGTPMVSDWREVRGPGVNRRELVTHKVIFYREEE